MCQQVGRIFSDPGKRGGGVFPESFATDLYNLAKKKKRDMVMKKTDPEKGVGAWSLQHSSPPQPMLGLCDFLNTFLVQFLPSDLLTIVSLISY